MSEPLSRNRCLDRLGTVVEHLGARVTSPDSTMRRQSLALAKGLILRLGNPTPYRHIVVVGPTQVGKSSVINCLTRQPRAGVSPTAGFTRHAQAFASAEQSAVLAALAPCFPDWEQRTTEDLQADNANQYSVTQINPVRGREDLVFWDTPDFDSVSSREYRQMVPRICALADLLIVVVSKEKYADDTVWEFLDLIATLDLPGVLILNKTDAEAAELIRGDIEGKLSDRKLKFKQFVTIPRLPKGLDENSDALDAMRPTIDQCQSAQPSVKRYFDAHWSQWTGDVVRQNAARSEWSAFIETLGEELLAYYRRHYLEQDRHSEALRRAVARLLELLEIPALSKGLSTARQIITWPVRTLGKGVVNSIRGRREAAASDEVSVLTEATRRYIVAAEGEVARRVREEDGAPIIWWRQLQQHIDSTGIEEPAIHAISQLENDFEPEIDRAANQLLDKLKQHPKTLNSLRLARVSTDAGAVILAVHTGGLSTADLLLAPALLSVTSLIAESAAGRAMKDIERDLKGKQFDAVKSILVEQLLQPAMLATNLERKHQELFDLNDQSLAEAKSCLGQLP